VDAEESLGGYTITNFHDEIIVQKNADLEITETIAVDFGSNERHGIYRTIPTKYSTSQGLTRSIRISNIAVDQDSFKISRTFGELTIKIGDADKLITGQHTYRIHYRVQNALNGFADHTELYWNVTGNGWNNEISQASANVTLPQQIPTSNTQQTAYEGIVSSTNLASANFAGSTFQFANNNPLYNYEGLTIVAGWPTSVVTLPSTWTKVWWFLQDNWPLFIPIIVLFLLIKNFLRFGKDPSGRRTIVPEFAAPKNITLAQANTLKTERFQDQNLTALIIEWAVAGHIHINEPKKGQYELQKIKGLTNATSAEKAVFLALFSDNRTTANLTTLKHDTKLIAAKSSLEKETFDWLVANQYFAMNPNNIRIAFIAAGIVLIFISFALAAIIGTAGAIAGTVSGLLILIFAPFMPKRTLLGVHKKEEILGFELYLKTAERYRMQFAEKEKLFEKFLPYAIAFGVAGLWAKAFKDIATAAPSWYSGYYASNWSVINFTNGLNSDFSSSMSTITSASSGGSGFSGGGSGGGFGGGGGGSW
jgi:uncharacterized membrane protein YgcG